jgi:hypothetical protein
LLKKSAELAKKMGYKAIATEATNDFTVKIFQGLFHKCQIWKEMDYQSYKCNNGEKAFPTLFGKATFLEAKLS